MSSIAGKGCERLIPTEEKKPLEEIERSLVKKYRKHIWTKFVKAVKDYNLVEEGDKIAVAISGGKDSLLMAKCFQELKKHGQMNFELEFIAMDPGYHPQIKELLIENCNHLGIPVHIYEGKIFEVVDKMARDYPCYLCARMRRGSLYSKAKELGCNKLALGHHYNDVIETTLLNVLYAGNFKTMLPKLKAANFEGMELIRPLYYVEEEYIKRFTNNAGIWPLNCACMVSAEKIGNKRYEIKELIKELKKNFDGVEKSIFKSAENVSLDSILGWEKDGIKTKYLEVYDEE
ncbi:ATP-binding protein [Clostridium tertium]|jgi:tRNA 2-thiocytidine biosynthesis protein TtcA|uniref:tRNA 2-thiocytidine biosynthesis TtcA family protein n=1 Tax=Clostridium TaxID=1485 RepID=UPI000C089E89|nr:MULTISPECIES: ATP-binding protein [Clostridium]MDB1924284.1 ATP-binding protein [Clostridium tertium]MDB1927477.1 ATP-binding protein [Clostridium tertium]MDB1931168.1 ATP-binding protein [Clostridium tertium]MDB1935284.1 ATP-binding protein [Clostridium tertium]MDB1936342.1 ATP-binding protein [Clostridium tertium]